MKRPGKLTFYFWLVVIVCFFVCSITGVSIVGNDGKQIKLIRGANEIDWGIDVLGGVSVTFSTDESVDEGTLDLLRERLINRLEKSELTDYELFVDENSNSILVSFPWVQNESGDAVEIIDYLSTVGCLRVIEGAPSDIAYIARENGREYVYDSSGICYAVVMSNDKAEETELGYDALGFRTVTIRYDEEGRALLAEGTGRQLGGKITLWLDDKLVSTMSIYTVNSSGELIIGKGGGLEEATAENIVTYLDTGALPVKIWSGDYEITDPAFADNTLSIMVTAGIIALCLIFAFFLLKYRAPGFVSCVAILGHTGCLLATASGFFAFFDGVTMTLPGIAGMMLSVGMAIDANILTAEKIKEEVCKGKSLHGSVDAGCKNSISSIIDGNITMMIISIILIGAFGPPNNIFSIILYPVMWVFSRATTETIYAFGYMLLSGVIFNVIICVFVSRIMLRSIVQNKAFHIRWLYGGAKANEKV